MTKNMAKSASTWAARSPSESSSVSRIILIHSQTTALMIMLNNFANKYSMACLERMAVIPIRTIDILRSLPEVANQLQHFLAYPMECQDDEASASVHGIKLFLQVNEATKEWHLLQMRELLGEFCLDDPRPCASPCKTPMQAVVEDNILQPEIHHLLENLPNRF